MHQLENVANLDRISDPRIRLLAEILIGTGLRIGDATRLQMDCLVRDPQGAVHLLLLFVSSDDPTVLRDHPWWFVPICLHRGYLEITRNATRVRRPGNVAVRRARHRHRIQLLANPDGTERGCWTILVTGPPVASGAFFARSRSASDSCPRQQFGRGGCNPDQPKPATQRQGPQNPSPLDD